MSKYTPRIPVYTPSGIATRSTPLRIHKGSVILDTLALSADIVTDVVC